jgi:Zn-finger nucleic acid-binding protein
MPQKNCDPALRPIDPVLCDASCPKCGVEMEPIEMGVEGLPLQQLQLCPGCYMVMWIDQGGLHVRQGVPMKKGINPRSQPRSLFGEPVEC